METPHETTFLSVLQRLLQIDVTNELGDVIWETVDKLVAGATMLIGRPSDAERLLADGTRRLGRAVSRPRPRNRSERCSTTCQCDCHDDVSTLQSPSSRNLSTDTGMAAFEDTGRIGIVGFV